MLHTNVKFGKVFDIRGQFAPAGENVAFKNLWNNEKGGVTLLTFGPKQELSEHLSPAELMVCVIEGAIEFTILDHDFYVEAGEFLMLGEGVPHRVQSKEGAKVMLVKVKSDKL